MKTLTCLQRTLLLVAMALPPSAGVFAAEFEAGVEPFLGEPKVETQQVFRGGRFPNINVATDGTVLAAWGGKGVEVRRSEDGGASWGEPISVADPGFMGGGVTVDEGTGDVLAFVETHHPPADIKVYRSKDHGKTWVAQEDATIHNDKAGHQVSMHMNEHGITLRHGEKKGRLVRASRYYGGKNERARWPYHYTNAIYSDDGGKTWHTSDPFPENGTGEACIVELSDGRLLYNSRVHWDKRPNFNRRRQAISTDGGQTWDEWRIVDALPDGQQQRSYGCMGGMCRLPVKGEDIIVFSNLDTPNPRRERGTVWASFDGGQTWPVKRLVVDGPSGYSSIIAGRPGTASEGWIYLMAESGGAKVARFNLSWLLGGEATGDGEIPVRFRTRKLGEGNKTGTPPEESAQELAVAGGGEVDFSREVLPILSNKCFVCHGPDAKKNDLRLDSREGAVADLGGYRAIDPSDPSESEILVRIHDKEDPMPPEKAEKKLTPAERETLSRWVKQGGDYAKHWAFVKPEKTEIPNVRREHMIDAFIAAPFETKSENLAPEADRRTLARRASLVLTGLPPSPADLKAFLADGSPDAYGRYVDRLMTTPQYGEHQARYWLDAVRYGDTHGLHLDNKRGIYPYRDWVVRAFNGGLPLDKFVTHQLAGDLMPDPSLAQLVATGFVRMNPTTAEGGAIPAEFQVKNNFDRTEMLGTVMLGMTMTCARCHTHKYDPITQTEYYELLAFFNSTAENPMDGNKYEYAPVIKAPSDQAGWDKLADWEKRRDALLAKFPKLEGTKSQRLEKIADPNGPLADEIVRPEAEGLIAQRAEMEKSFTTTLVAKDLGKPRPTRVLHRGEYDQPQGAPLEAGIPAAMGIMGDATPRNRLGLAQWLTSRDNPLVARVMVNRIWASVFGHALVRTPEDFGLQGQQPTHPELLDWLAVELQDSGWDMRHMLRLMVTSKTFKQQSRWQDGIDDPDNRRFMRGPAHRLDAEVLRDTALWASGLLDPTMGGEGVKPEQPPGLWKALMHPASNTKNYVADKDERVYRRSLYVYWKRTSPHPMMTLFDAPNRESACVGRSRSNTALQSLGLLNERQRLQAANGLAARVLRAEKDDAKRLDLMFALLASRAADGRERDVCNALLAGSRERYETSPEDAAELLKAGDCGRGKGLDSAEHAAWAQVASVVLASDAAILLY